MSKTIIISVTLFLIVLFGFAFISNRQEAQQPTSISTQNQAEDKQASFAIFTNGTFRVFTAAMYHKLSPDVYIQANNPNIVHVKKDGITWNVFFETLPFKLTKDCLTTGTKEIFCTNGNDSLRFYLNGNLDQNALNKEINNGDQLLISFGRENEQQIQTQLQRIPKVINN